MLPDQFDGVSSWADYLLHFESVATINQWRETEKAMFLASRLRGLALEALADMAPEACRVYSSILEYFEKRFGDTAKVPLHQIHLSMRTRGHGETISSLGQSIRRLVSKSYPRWPIQDLAVEDLAVDAFRNALGDEYLQQHLFSKKVTTLSEAITLATEMEAFLDWQTQQRKENQGSGDVMSVVQPPPRNP